jgi:hypothetical protein
VLFIAIGYLGVRCDVIVTCSGFIGGFGMRIWMRIGIGIWAARKGGSTALLEESRDDGTGHPFLPVVELEAQ